MYKNQMKQVFINLIQNAIEATENGGNIYIESKVIDDMHICIRFIDEGCGYQKNDYISWVNLIILQRKRVRESD